ncbi:unnamed protein product [marine sediment metagenome]|uniref:Uncharacterized protein n=1 Tax=marine sediment metagenome TaxID=412755 RepID=X1F2R7_9ZZZZ
MALVKYGGGIIQMSGSMAGNTFARNRYCNYVRARTKPINPNTDRQGQVRGYMASASHYWSNTLTPAQRNAWNEYASNVQVTNKLGESIFLSGFNMFCRSVTAELNAGLNIVPDAPALFTLPDTDPTVSATGVGTTDIISVAFDDTMDWVDEDGAALLSYTGQPKSAGVSFFDGPWRYMDKILGDAVTAPTTPAAQTSPYNISADQKVYTKYRIIRADGRLSEFFRAPAFVVT